MHLEECADESEVLISKDDHTQEGGESSVEDMGASPEMHCIDIKIALTGQSDMIFVTSIASGVCAK